MGNDVHATMACFLVYRQSAMTQALARSGDGDLHAALSDPSLRKTTHLVYQPRRIPLASTYRGDGRF